ncbi:unnamed protein product [Schistosoma mattheei]|uniref:Uncharacterized protein n=1 Tax=Schistosoma mattheei TaxID=31246 RepID=A0A183PHX3_9TREM|nr:unnamed protein product [Schistosoma mattheei]
MTFQANKIMQQYFQRKCHVKMLTYSHVQILVELFPLLFDSLPFFV